jgi:hypothetical protein
MLKAQMGDREVNLPAWIQDHITNAESYIYQAAKGYHESDAQMDDNAGSEEMNEAFKIEFDDNGNPIKIPAILANGTPFEKGEKAQSNRIHYTSNPYPKGSEEYDEFYNGWMNAETASQMAHDEFMFRKERGMDEVFQSKESNDDKIAKYEKYTYTLDGEVVEPEITFLNNILKAMLGNKIYNIGAPENNKIELTPESGKKGTYTESQELDEWTISRWQHYAGIK